MARPFHCGRPTPAAAAYEKCRACGRSGLAFPDDAQRH